MNLVEAVSSGRPRKKRKRVGRGPGSGHGKTSTRGQKGAHARSGFKRRLSYEGGQMPLFRRLPKRGFNNAAYRRDYQHVNVAALDRFEAGSTVGPDELCSARLVRHGMPVKILAMGSLGKALTVRAHRFSKAAIQKIEAAGGTVVIIEAAGQTKRAQRSDRPAGPGDRTAGSDEAIRRDDTPKSPDEVS